MRLDDLLAGADLAPRQERQETDPTMDLPDFDDMPINMEDINQSQKKLDEIINQPIDEAGITAESYEIAGSQPNTVDEATAPDPAVSSIALTACRRRSTERLSGRYMASNRR